MDYDRSTSAAAELHNLPDAAAHHRRLRDAVTRAGRRAPGVPWPASTSWHTYGFRLIHTRSPDGAAIVQLVELLEKDL